MNPIFEIDYEIASIHDEYGDFPLQCATILFDLLNIKSNIVIKNQYSIKPEKAKVLSQYISNEHNCFHEWPKSPEGNYCVWIKHNFSTNQQLVDILRLQGTYLSYIAPNDLFAWDDFLKNWSNDERYLILSEQASFVCNVFDMDRTLNINFNTADFSIEEIASVLAEWEGVMSQISKPIQLTRNVSGIRGKYGDKHLVRLSFK